VFKRSAKSMIVFEATGGALVILGPRLKSLSLPA
jgi:hypothetical protein